MRARNNNKRCRYRGLPYRGGVPHVLRTQNGGKMKQQKGFAYVRKAYGSKVKRGMKVLCQGKYPGVAVSADSRINVRLVGDRFTRQYHPDDVVPLEY